MDLSKIDHYANREDFISTVQKKAFDMEMKCHGCAQVIVQTFLDILEIDSPYVSMAASPMAAGLSLTGNNCGAIIGSLMVLGLQYGRQDVNEGMEGIVKGIQPMRRCIRNFHKIYGEMNCRDLTGTDLANPEKATAYFDAGGLEKCANMLADTAGYVAGVLYDERMSNK